MIYLDNASATPLLEDVKNEMSKSLKEMFGDSCNTVDYGLKTKVKIEESRRKIAGIINCNPEDIIFTSGGTEANNLAVFGTIKKNNIKTAVCSPLEHPSVIKPLEYLADKNQIKLLYLNIDNHANISLTELDEILSQNQNSFVSVSHSNYLTGNLLPIKKVSEICHKYNSFFHTDMVQSMAYLKNDFSAMNFDLASVSAHKFHGPKGIGFLFIKPGLNIENLMFGDNNEYSIRPGTENVSGILGMTKALELMQQNVEENFGKCIELKKTFYRKLEEKGFSVVQIGEAFEKTLPNILSVSLTHHKNIFTLLNKISYFDINATFFKKISLGSERNFRFSFSFLNNYEEIEKCF